MNVSPARPAPSPSLGSPTPTDIQDTQSSHSDQNFSSIQHQPPPSLVVANQQQQHDNNTTANSPSNGTTNENYGAGVRRQHKTEYKSNFKPFDQYVYNELTDSFVKQKSPTAQSPNMPAAAGSHQDLSSTAMHVDAYATCSISPALEAGAFEPSTTGEQNRIDVTQEPWYMEVMKRNEKANEYRYKSEHGHSSPLAAEATNLDAEQQQHHQQLDPNSPAPTEDQAAVGNKRAIAKFSPHDYKRDHLISTMANNNNFKLTKEQPYNESASSRRAAGASTAARSPAVSSARPLTRSTASSRARSQSSRRQVAGATTNPATASSTTKTNKPTATGASKSNQSSPIKQATTRVTSLANRTSLAPTARAPATRSAVASKTATSNSTASNSSNGLSLSRPSSTLATTSRRTTPTSRVAASTSSRLPESSGSAASSTRTTTTRSSTASRTSTLGATSSRTTTTTTTMSATSGRGQTTSSKTSTTSTTSKSMTSAHKASPQSPVKRSTGLAARTTAAPSRPTTAAAAASRNSLSSRQSASRNGSTSAASSSSNTASNAPKSIKSKALADAGEKAAALAAATAAVGVAATVAAGVASTTDKPASRPVESNQLDAQLEMGQSNLQTEMTSQLDHQNAGAEQQAAQAANYYLNQEPNLIIKTTETGNMLADEIARAEREAQEAELRARQEPQQVDDQFVSRSLAQEVAAADQLGAQPVESPIESQVHSQVESVQNVAQQEVFGQTPLSLEQENDQELSEQLVNGLSGGIVSAEDRYDSSERDESVNDFERQATAAAADPLGQLEQQQQAREQQQQQEHQDENEDEEPYSLMPTTFNAARQEEPIEATQQYTSKAFGGVHQLEVSHEKPQEGGANLSDELEVAASELTGEVQFGEKPEEFARGEESADSIKRVEFDLAERRHSVESVEPVDEPKIFQTEVSATQLEAGQPNDSEQLGGTLTPINAQVNDKDDEEEEDDDEPYEHLEPEQVHDEPNDLQFGDQPQEAQQENLHANSDEKPDEMKVDEDEFEIIEKEADELNESDEVNQNEPQALGQTVDLSEQSNAENQPEQKLGADESEAVEAEPQAGEVKEANEESKQQDDLQQLELAQERAFTKTVDVHKLTADDTSEQLAEVEATRAALLDELQSSTASGAALESSRDDHEHKQVEQEEPHANHVLDERPFVGDLGEQTVDQAADSEDYHKFGGSDSAANELELTTSEKGEDDDLELAAEAAVAAADHSSELLMNVADLVDAEARMKQEMTRKSELARQQSNSRSSLTFPQAGEILLAPDQLAEHFASSQTQSEQALDNAHPLASSEEEDKDKDEVIHLDDELEISSVEQQRSSSIDFNATKLEGDGLVASSERVSVVEKSEQKQQQGSDSDLVNFGSLTPTQELAQVEPQQQQQQQQRQHQVDATESDDSQNVLVRDEQEEELVSRAGGGRTFHISSAEALATDNQQELQAEESDQHQLRQEEEEGGQEEDNDRTRASTRKATNLLDDDLMEDDEEQQKLSNHLTNSDDDVILAPRNTKESAMADVVGAAAASPLMMGDEDCFSPQKATTGSRYNEGAGLSSLTQRELDDDDDVNQLDAIQSVALAEAQLEQPTVAEERVELATATSSVASFMPNTLTSQRAGSFALASGNTPVAPHQDDDDDDDAQDLGLDPNADPIDVAATLSPASSSAAEEVLQRLSRQTSLNTSEVKLFEEQLTLELRRDSGGGGQQLSASVNRSESLDKDADTRILNTQADHLGEPKVADQVGSDGSSGTSSASASEANEALPQRQSVAQEHSNIINNNHQQNINNNNNNDGEDILTPETQLGGQAPEMTTTTTTIQQRKQSPDLSPDGGDSDRKESDASKQAGGGDEQERENNAIVL